MIQLSAKGLPRNPAFYAYYQRQLARERPSTGVDIDFQKVNQHHLWNVEKQDRVCDAKGAGQLRLNVIFCSKDRKNKVVFYTVNELALESVDFFQRERNCLKKHECSDSMSRVAQYLVSIQIKLSGVYTRLMCDQMETDFGDKE